MSLLEVVLSNAEMMQGRRKDRGKLLDDAVSLGEAGDLFGRMYRDEYYLLKKMGSSACQLKAKEVHLKVKTTLSGHAFSLKNAVFLESIWKDFRRELYFFAGGFIFRQILLIEGVELFLWGLAFNSSSLDHRGLSSDSQGYWEFFFSDVFGFIFSGGAPNPFT